MPAILSGRRSVRSRRSTYFAAERLRGASSNSSAQLVIGRDCDEVPVSCACLAGIDTVEQVNAVHINVPNGVAVFIEDILQLLHRPIRMALKDDQSPPASHNTIHALKNMYFKTFDIDLDQDSLKIGLRNAMGIEDLVNQAGFDFDQGAVDPPESAGV